MRLKNFQIADLAGVSTSTVSRVINGTGEVSEQKRNRILEILRQNQDDSLKSEIPAKHKGSLTIGILSLRGGGDDPSDTLCKLAEVIAQGKQKSFRTMMIPNDLSPNMLETMFLRHDLDGLLIVGFGDNDPVLATVLKRIPYVWLNSHETGFGEKNILLGDELAGRLAAEYLLSRHRNKVACVRINSHNPGMAARLEGFLYTFYANQQKFIELNCKAPRVGGFEFCTHEEIELSLQPVVEQTMKEKYDGIFLPTERLAASFHRTLLKSGVAPKDFPLLITCNNSLTFLAGLYPRPTTINMNPFQIARLAVEKLLSQLKHDSTESSISVVIQPTIVPGDL